MNTREKILDKALEMFNERGIEYVGLRELAAVLEMRVGNITYYFPTKDDLVYELSLGLRDANAGLMTKKEQLTMSEFLEMLHRVFQNHVKYQCLLLSVVHLMKQNKHMEASYRKTQKQRTASMQSNLRLLADTGYLTIEDKVELDFLVKSISLVSRFWISEAAISYQQLSPAEQIRPYLELVTGLLKPYSTTKAKKEIQSFLNHR